jgi:hydroxypyruvate reductase
LSASRNTQPNGALRWNVEEIHGTTLMTRERVLITSKVVAELVELSPSAYDIFILEDHADQDAWLAANGAGFRAMICAGTERLDVARLHLLPQLELIAVIAAGMAGIDLSEAQRRGIAVCNAGDLNAGDVADFAVALMLAHRRNLLGCDAWVRRGEWPKGRIPRTRSIAAERVGIVGLGNIGLATAQRLAPFGCEIRWWNRSARPDAPWPREQTLAGLCAWASVVIVTVAGTESTQGLIDRELIEAVGLDGLIVNVARGFVIDEAALKAALRERLLGGAALDVVAHEPDDGSGWADVPGVILAPHVAGSTRESFAAVMSGAADNVRRLFAGEPLLRIVG